MGIFECISAGNVVSVSLPRMLAKRCLGDHSFLIVNRTQYELLVHAVAREVHWKRTTNASGKIDLSVDVEASVLEERTYGAAKKQTFRLKPGDVNVVLTEEDTCYLTIFQLSGGGANAASIKDSIMLRASRIKRYEVRDRDVDLSVVPASIGQTALSAVRSVVLKQDPLESYQDALPPCHLDRWTIESASLDEVYIRGVHGRYLMARYDGSVIMSEARGEWQRWRIERNKDARVLVRSKLGMYLHAQDEGEIAQSQNAGERETWEIRKYGEANSYFAGQCHVKGLSDLEVSFFISSGKNLQSIGNGLVWLGDKEI